MRATAILVRWQGGYRWVADSGAPLRIEIAQGHSGDSSEVIAKATAEVNTYSDGQTEITVGVDPETGDPVWGEDIDVGDEVFVDGGWREIEAYAASVDDDTGRVVGIIPQFGVVLDEPDERIARTFRAIGGLNQGTSHLARPVASVSQPNVRP